MTFKNCIDEGVAENQITQEQADEIKTLFNELEVQYNNQMGGAAAAKAAADTSIAAKKIAIEKKTQGCTASRDLEKINYDLENYRTLTGKADKAEAALSLFVKNETARFFWCIRCSASSFTKRYKKIR